MSVFEKLASLLALPLVLINTVGAIVAGIWLAILGEWGSIGWGIVMLMLGGFGLGLAMLPGLLLGGPAMAFHSKGIKVGFYFFGFLSSLFTIAVLSVWCIAVLYFFAKRADDSSIYPLLLWSYGVATGPIAWLAQKEANEFAMMSTFFAQVGYLVVILVVWLTRVTIIDVFILFGTIMFIGLIFQYQAMLQEERFMRRNDGV